MNKEQVRVAFCNVINKVTGKQNIINAYEDKMSQIAKYTDTLKDGSVKSEIIKQTDIVAGSVFVDESGYPFYVRQYSPYSLKTSKKEVCAKVKQLDEVIKKYGIDKTR